MIFVLSTFLTSIFTLAAPAASILIHPIFTQRYACSEHANNELPELGDALGSDCAIQEFQKEGERGWYRSYKNNGFKNSDWFGWHKNVLSPIEGTVVKVNTNNKTNEPGILGKGPASFILLESKNNEMVLLAHVEDIAVKVGDTVKAGQAISKVGNNGYSRHPHIHIGAWKDKTPLQIRFDQKYIPIE